MHNLLPDGEVLSVCCEAKPWGQGTYRQICAMGQDCIEAAPGLIPCKATDWIKIDRQEALSFARLHRTARLTRV